MVAQHEWSDAHVKRSIVIGVVVVLLVGAAFFGGTYFARSSATGGAPGGAPGGLRGAGGPMGQLTEAQQAEIEGMTEEERMAGPRGAGGGLVEGEVIEVATDTLTLKVGTNSQTVYVDEDTVIAYEDGAAKIAAGSKVLVFSQPAADNVNTAQAIVVKK